MIIINHVLCCRDILIMYCTAVIYKSCNCTVLEGYINHLLYCSNILIMYCTAEIY